MSFQEDCVRFGDQLVRLADSGVSVTEAAVAIGLPRSRCYAILRAIGRPMGKPRGRAGTADVRLIATVFGETGSITRAAKASGVAHTVARRILVAEGLVSSEKLPPKGKPEAKRRCLELIEAGWSTTRAAREVGVNERTARDWRQGIRHSRNWRIHPDGRVVDYTRGTVYNQSVTSAACADPAQPAISDRYLSIEDRIAIADGLLVKDSLRTIAIRIGKDVSTVSREVRRHSIDGRYLPYQADREAAAARERRSSPNWFRTRSCVRRWRKVCPGSCLPSRSHTACAGTSLTTRVCG